MKYKNVFFGSFLIAGCLCFSFFLYLFPGNERLSLRLSAAKDIFNIIFFAIASTITILSYVQAKKTLFSPIRTEIFKFQLKMFEDILDFFQDKKNDDFIDDFDLFQIVLLNAFRMADEYAANFFPENFTITPQLKENRSKCFVYEVFAPGYADKHLVEFHINNPTAYIEKNEKVNAKNREEILSEWQQYSCCSVGVTKTYEARIKKLSVLIASPLLPRQLRHDIKEFKKIVEINLALVREVITSCSKVMSDNYKTWENMKDFSAYWVWNEYNKKMKPLEPVAQEILIKISEYLKVENLME